jgi:hypothetical protein
MAAALVPRWLPTLHQKLCAADFRDDCVAYWMEISLGFDHVMQENGAKLVAVQNASRPSAKAATQKWRSEMSATLDRKYNSADHNSRTVIVFLHSSSTPVCAAKCADETRWKRVQPIIGTVPIGMTKLAHGQPRLVVCVLSRHHSRKVFADVMKSSVADRRYMNERLFLIVSQLMQMKCEPAQGGPCRRCRNSKIECVFRPRANARQPAAMVSPKIALPHEPASPDVMARLAVIEAVLGISRNNDPRSPGSGTVNSTSPIITANLEEEDQDDPSLSGLWPALESLKGRNATTNTRLWSRSVISQLWLS